MDLAATVFRISNASLKQSSQYGYEPGFIGPAKAWLATTKRRYAESDEIEYISHKIWGQVS